MTQNKKMQTNLGPMLLLALAIAIAFSPTFFRMMGFELIQTTNSRLGERITQILSLAGGGMAAWAVWLWWSPNNNPKFVLLYAALIAVAVTVLAWYTNVFSMFAF